MPTPIGSVIVDEIRRADGESYQPAPSWQRRVPAAPGNWTEICWSPALALFCAVSSDGKVMTSPDGLTWTSQTPASAQSWASVCWSPALGLFCAVASNGAVGVQVMTSPDGVVWTSRTSASAQQWYSVCWSPEQAIFCAVAITGAVGVQVMTSANGIAWASQTSAAALSWSKVVWADRIGLFVARATLTAGDSIMTSPTGVVWTLQTSPISSTTSFTSSLGWSSELNILVASARYATNGNRIAYSTNGINWQLGPPHPETVPITPSYFTWAKEVGLFIATSISNILISSDGLFWTRDMTPANSAVQGVAWSSSLWMAAAVPASASYPLLTRSFPGAPNFAPNNQLTGAGANAGTLLNAPAAGNPTFWLPVTINGVRRFIPAW